MNLTTVDRYKRYVLGAQSTLTAQDSVLTDLITRASGFIAKWCSRSFGRVRTIGARFDGLGGKADRLMLPNTPILSVEALEVDGTVIPYTSDPRQRGYQFDDTMLYAFGFLFLKGRRNILLSYTAGYAASETDLIPAATPYALTPTTADSQGNDGAVFAASDLGVVFAATGAALTAVAASPAAGQYSFSGGTYTFAAADAGKSVTMSYDYVPGAVEQACIEIVAMKVKQRNTIGVSSQGIGGETITFTDRDMSPAVKAMLLPYNLRVPL